MTPWRTQTVVALCQAIRQERDYSALPILADALEDADFGDEAALVQMRSGPSAIAAQRLIALIYSAETAEAVKQIESIAATLGDGAVLELGDDYNQSREMNYETIMDGANRWLDSEDFTTEHGSDNWRDDFPAYAAEFWKSYELITGRKPADGAPSFFACSC